MKAITAVEEEVINQVGELGKMDLGTTEYEKTVNGIATLLDKVNDSKRIDLEAHEKEASREQDAEIKMEQIKEDRRSKIVPAIITTVGVIVTGVISAAVSTWGTKTVLTYEDKGVIPDSTAPGKSFMKRLFKD